MRELTIDGARMHSREAIFRHLKRLFGFREDFGNNLDALWDALTEETEPTVIHFHHVAVFLEEMGDYGEKLVRVFKTLERRTENYKVYFYTAEIND